MVDYMCKVSVIIPVYNASDYIEKTLDSLISQNFKDFDVIIIDDGSTDDSVKTINNYLKNKKLGYKIYTQDNLGVSAARNLGLIKSTSEYIIFLDDDDIVTPNHIENLYNKTIEHKSDSTFTYLSKVKNNELLTEYSEYNKLNNRETVSADNLIKLELLMEIPFSFVELIYKKELIEKYNIQFNENSIYGEDTDFALKYLTHCDDIAINHEFSYLYIQADSSATSTTFLERFQFINLLEEYVNYYNKYSKTNNLDIENLVLNNRIPKAIFGNLMFMFYNDCPYYKIMKKVYSLKLLDKLKNFTPISNTDKKFNIKIRLFLISPKIYYLLWKKFKNKI